ncbi:hypothetical protein N0V93_003895 [Gnomoniopsis smithogilvyi]|uniref:F-box domain-containing protein n=1 Tax=Gnomoniopsis smithogilvyi TaxID=1191159 RepID=A0A9W9CZK4_9PEZI|nr:hypothetical protein N0V93_003895 [Gnomoniopsis smithogilvyi]
MEIINLPHDLFLLIVARLSSRTVVLCRRVSKGWNNVFTDQDLNLQLLKDRFPRCRELRLAYAAAVAAATTTTADRCSTIASVALVPAPPESLSTLERINGILESSNEIQGQDWASTFASVASRYHHLRTATPRSISKIRLGTTGRDKYRFYGVATWDRYLRLDDKTAPFHYPDPSWCYAQEEGLLVFHVHPDDIEDSPRTYVYPWRLLDLETGEKVEVAFPHDDERVVRRVRLAAGVLVFEWCERLAYHQLNDREECHRHYVTAFDIVRNTTSSPSSNTGTWDTIQRAEWKLHFLGLPLNHTDRFLSTHTATHYAVYVWQPNRSPWGEDDPIESVIVWDISSSTEPPRIVRRMTWPVLAFYGVRQRATPRLRCLGMDERNIFFVEEEHRWAQGGHSSLSPPRVHLVKTTGVPVIPGPVKWQASHEHTADQNGAPSEDEDDIVTHGPPWLDKCGANGDVNLSFCSRLDKPSYFHSTDASCTSSGGSPGIWNGFLPGSRTPNFTQEIRAAINASPTRWPGWAPCWRHEEFPYLTVSEMVDFKAGVWVTARHCFMLETLSVHARPSLSIRGPGVGSSAASSVKSASTVQEIDAGLTQSVNTRLNGKLKAGENDKRKGGRERSVRGGEDEMGGDDEVQFADEMWDRLLGKGFICGDERWLIGEDREGSITIVRF